MKQKTTELLYELLEPIRGLRNIIQHAGIKKQFALKLIALNYNKKGIMNMLKYSDTTLHKVFMEARKCPFCCRNLEIKSNPSAGKYLYCSGCNRVYVKPK